VIGTYLDQLEEIAETFDAPLITGKTRTRARELFPRFRVSEIKLSSSARSRNFSIDLRRQRRGQVSGTFGSRQEEAQRLGRILRPKDKTACFYTVVTKGSKEQEFAMKRQLFLTEQGYQYFIEDRAAK
jgi:DNA excision repair protein ERCC-3